MYCAYYLSLETFRCTVDHSQASVHCYLPLIFLLCYRKLSLPHGWIALRKLVLCGSDMNAAWTLLHYELPRRRKNCNTTPRYGDRVASTWYGSCVCCVLRTHTTTLGFDQTSTQSIKHLNIASNSEMYLKYVMDNDVCCSTNYILNV